MASIFIYGRPGSGKTTLATTMTNLGYKLHFIDADKKILTQRNIQPLVEKGLVTYSTLQSKLTESSLVSRAKDMKKAIVKQPGGYLEFVGMIDDLETNPLADAEITIPVIDSLSRVLEHLKRFLTFSEGTASMQIQTWGYYLANLEELFTTFYGLQPGIYPHCIMIAHAMEDKDEKTGALEIMPLIDGQMRGKASSYVEEAYFCQCTPSRIPGGDPEYQVVTRPINRVTQARTSWNAPTIAKADFAELFKDREDTPSKRPVVPRRR